MPHTIRIGIIVACRRLDMTAWTEAKAVVDGCTVTFVTSRGGGTLLDTVDGLTQVNTDAFHGACNTVFDTLVQYTPHDEWPKRTCKAKMDHSTHPVVWISCRHSEPGKTRPCKQNKHTNRGSRGGGSTGSRGGGLHRRGDTTDHR